MLTRRDVDAARVVVVGNDIALITAALTSGATHVVTTPALFYRTAELAPKTQAYPLEEINDYLRLRPARAEAVRRTLANFDLVGLAPRVNAATLVMAGAPGSLLDAAALRPMTTALRGPVTVMNPEQSLYKDGLYASAGWPSSAASRTSRASCPSTGGTRASGRRVPPRADGGRRGVDAKAALRDRREELGEPLGDGRVRQ